MHRKQLLASQVAVCCYCFADFADFADFAPDAIGDWCDGDEQGQTAICPYCGVDAVVGFNGPIDVAWVKAAHQRGFG